MSELFKEKFAVFLVGAALAVAGAGIKIYVDVHEIESLRTDVQDIEQRMRACQERISRMEGRMGKEHGGM